MVTVALGQLNLTVGDLDGNVDRMTRAAADATAMGADVVAFPELAITGYPPEDLVLRTEFVRDNLAALDELAQATSAGCDVIVGFVDRNDRRLHNAAAVLRGGEIVAKYHKCHLPNYGVFDERRYFTAGETGAHLRIADVAVGLSVCEDAWKAGPPWTAYTDVPVIVNINGSPYHRGKVIERSNVLRDRAAETGAAIVYVNTVGGQDELVFDGGSLVMAPDGEIVSHASLFDEDLLLVDIDGERIEAESRPPWPEDTAEVYAALVLGTRDYVRKNGFGEVVLGLSGGIDSALVATIAADALGPEAVRALAMPSSYSSSHSTEDAESVARALDIRYDVVAISDVFDMYRKSLATIFGDHPEDVTEENLQARIRGNYLMAVSNRFGSIVLATGNKTEYAVGYSTLYGDMAGGFAPIKDVPKLLVYELARWRNARDGDGGPIPERVLTKAPSAELRPDQKDEDTLPPYAALDPIVELYVEDDLGVEEIVRRGHDRPTVERVARMIDLAEYKRRQAAPGVKITPKAFGRDRRLPITSRYGRRS